MPTSSAVLERGDGALAPRQLALAPRQLLRERVQLLGAALEMLLGRKVVVASASAAPDELLALVLQAARRLLELLLPRVDRVDPPPQRQLQRLHLGRGVLPLSFRFARVLAKRGAELLDVGVVVVAVSALVRSRKSHERDDRTRAMPQRLTPEDARILALESGPIVGHTCKVLIADRAGDTVSTLRATIERRIGLARRCRQRLAPTPLRLAPPAWIDDPAFEAAAHVRRVAEEPVDHARLLELVGELMSERLPRDRPLWAIDVVDLEGDQVAAIWRIHHAMADGQATIGIGSALLWSDVPDPPAAPAPPPIGAAAGAAGLVAAAVSERAQALAEAASRIAGGLAAPTKRRAAFEDLRRAPATLRRELWPAYERSPFDAHIGRRRVVGFADHDLEDVHRAAHAAGDGITINDVLLSLVAGGLRRWLLERHGSPGPLRAQVPVSMHRPDEAPGAVPNRDSFINVELPVDEADPLKRLRAIGSRTQERKAARDADELYALFADVGRVSKGLFRLAHRLASNPHVFALSISNVRGPTGELYFAGGRLRALYSLAEIAPHHALRVSAESAVGRLWIGLCADADAVPDLHVLVSGLHDAHDELRTALRLPA